MESIKPEIISFVDQDSESEGIIITRIVGDEIILTISLKDDGDIAAVLTVSTVEQVIESLQRAIASVKNSSKPTES